MRLTGLLKSIDSAQEFYRSVSIYYMQSHAHAAFQRMDINCSNA